MNNLPPEVAALLLHGVAKSPTVTATVGLPRRRALVEAGLLVARPGHLLVHPPLADPWTPMMEVQLRYPTSAAALRLAAWAYQLPPFNTRTPRHGDVAAGSGARLPGAHRLPDLRDDDITSIAGVRVTTPARTLADLGMVTSADAVERALETVLQRRLTTEAEIGRIVDRLRRAGRSGPATLAEVLRRRPAGAPPTESDLETRFLQAARGLGFPEPTHRQYRVALSGGGEARIDFMWRTAATDVLVEVDGAAVHANPDALVADLRRQNALQARRRVILRFTAADIDRHQVLIASALGRWVPRRRRQGQVQGTPPHFGQPAA